MKLHIFLIAIAILATSALSLLLLDRSIYDERVESSGTTDQNKLDHDNGHVEYPQSVYKHPAYQRPVNPPQAVQYPTQYPRNVLPPQQNVPYQINPNQQQQHNLPYPQIQTANYQPRPNEYNLRYQTPQQHQQQQSSPYHYEYQSNNNQQQPSYQNNFNQGFQIGNLQQQQDMNSQYPQYYIVPQTHNLPKKETENNKVDLNVKVIGNVEHGCNE